MYAACVVAGAHCVQHMFCVGGHRGPVCACAQDSTGTGASTALHRGRHRHRHGNAQVQHCTGAGTGTGTGMHRDRTGQGPCVHKFTLTGVQSLWCRSLHHGLRQSAQMGNEAVPTALKS